jgi:hypothetical protein
LSAADEFPKHPPADVSLPTRIVLSRAPGPHKNVDPITGNCAYCHSTPQEMVSGFNCEPLMGPHASALVALRRTIRIEDTLIRQAERTLLQHEDNVANESRHLRTAKAHLEELKASFEKLKAAG